MGSIWKNWNHTRNFDYRKLKIVCGNNVAYDFSDFKTFNDLFKDLRLKKIILDDTKMKQNEAKLNALSGYSPRNQNYIETKDKILVNAKLLQVEKTNYWRP